MYLAWLLMKLFSKSLSALAAIVLQYQELSTEI